MKTIDLEGMISIPYLKKTVFTGSHKEMNFMIRRQEGEGGDRIEAVVWPGPFIFSLTEEEKKCRQDFDFSEEGLNQAIVWLNRHYEEAF